MAKTLFIHSLFRSGSTYFFDKFRQDEKFICFYEPLHQDIIDLNTQNIDTFWKFSPKTHGTVMNHPRLNKAHFTEYKALFNDGEGSLPYFHKAYSFDEYTEVKSKDFKRYIDNFIDLGKIKNCIPTLQFNRTTLRINWFKKEYPDALNITLLRNPRDQFESYLYRENKVFEVMNLLIIKSSPQFSVLLEKLKIPSYTDETYKKEYLYYSEMNEQLSLTQKYEIFFTIWAASLKHAVEYADEIILMDKIQENDVYKQKMQEIFTDKFNYKIDFDDFAIKTNLSLSLKTTDYDLIESSIMSQVSISEVVKNLYKDITISRYKNEKKIIISDLKKCQNNLSELNKSIKELMDVKIVYSPLKKYKKYKAMIDTYFQFKT